MESRGIFIDGGWLVFCCLFVAWLVLMIRQRLKEENRVISEMERRRMDIEALVALDRSLTTAQSDLAQQASSHREKLDHLETSPMRNNRPDP